MIADAKPKAANSLMLTVSCLWGMSKLLESKLARADIVLIAFLPGSFKKHFLLAS
jgi:hypothetical protein